MARLLKGKGVAASLNERSAALTKELNEKGITPCLAMFRVGENESDLSYERGATKRCNETGVKTVNYVFPEDVSEDEFFTKLEEANNDENIHGILVFRPLPERFSDDKVRNAIKAEKDVDGCSDLSLAGVFINKNLGFAPCTAEAVMETLAHYDIDVTGKNVTVIGRSLVIGKPVSMMLLNKNATVTVCHSKSENIQEITKIADILVCATGRMESINGEYLSDGQTVIDVGINWNEKKNKLCGDVLFEEAEPLVKDITPVPGGIGGVTTSVLVNHVVNAAIRQNKSR